MGTQMLQGPSESYLRQQFPQLYGFLGGVTGTAPDEMAGSVLDPNTAAVRQGAEYGFPVGTALGVLPGIGPVIRATKGLPVGMGIKDVSSVYPQSENLILAQQRAALPVSQGGLGLPAGNTAEQRAAAMGIDVETSYIHSTSNPFTKINEDGKFSGIFTLPNYSANYGALNMPLVARGEIATSDDLRRLVKRPTKKMQMAIDERIPENVDIADATVEMQKLRNELAKKYGFSGVKVSDEFGQDTTALVNPENIRSRFAAFDPFRRSAAIAATMGVAAPDLLAAPAPAFVADQIDSINEIIKKKRKK
jgi:hypothetical protein